MGAESKLDLAKVNAESLSTMVSAEYNRENDINNIKLDHLKTMSELRINKQTSLTEIEVNKFEKIMATLGKETLLALAQSGMESQVKMLEGLGLKGYLLTDGKTPINLFDAADGMMKNKK